MISDLLACCVPGCGHAASRLKMPAAVEVICEAHYALASPTTLARRARREERLKALQARWDDATYFDRLVASGKYLKMCAVLSLAADSAERAWMDVKVEVMAAARPRRFARKVSAGFA